MESSHVALIILVITMVMFVWGKVPLVLTAICSALAMGIFGVIPYATVFSGFSNDTVMLVTGAMVIGETLFETGVAQKIGTVIIKVVGTNERLFVVVCVTFAALFSAVFSNVAVVGMMLPLMAGVAASSKGAIQKKNAYMAVGFAANIGGGMTLVGSSPNLILQGMLSDYGLETMGFFDLTWISLPRLIFFIAFYATIGYNLQKKIFDFEEVCENELAVEVEQRQYDNRKMIISLIILICMVVGFVSGIWSKGTVGMLCAMACIMTKCITPKQMFERIDWNAVWIMAGSLGFAAGVAQSGAGKLIADTVINMLGGNVSMFALLMIFTLLSVFLANIMSSTAASAMLGPIAFAMCQSLGYEAKPIAMVIVLGLNLAFLTPIATPTVTMTLVGGYRFSDYTKIGSLVMLGSLIFTIIMYPICFAL